MRKRLIALLLLFALCASLGIASYAAETAEEPGENENLIKNGDFETLTEDGQGFEDWTPYGGEWKDNAYCFVDSTYPYEGEHALLLDNDKNAPRPWIRQLVYGLTPGVYELSFDHNSKMANGAGAVKLELYRDGTMSAETGVLDDGLSYDSTNGVYEHYTGAFSVPKEADTVAIYLRHYGAGTSYYDNVALRKVDNLPFMAVSTDRYFYYPELTEGFVDIEFSDVFTYDGSDSVTVQFLDGDEVREEASFPVTGETITWHYPLSYMTEKKKEYYVKVTMYDKAKEEIESYTEGIYLYDRPKNLTPDGTYLKDGEPFVPVIAYHAFQHEFDLYKQAGVNTLQAGVADLQALKKNDMMGFMVLYASSGMFSEKWFSDLAKSIRQYKDNKNIFAWAIADEPGTREQDQLNLKRAAKIIRDNDPNHPVYIMQVALRNGAAVRQTSKNEDVVPIDPYPQSVDSRGYAVYDMTKRTVEIAGEDRPVYSILHAFWYGGVFWPTNNNLISYIYQALLAGARGIGYYSWDDCTTDSKTAGEDHGGPQIYKTELWTPLTRFTERAQTDAFDHFIFKKTPPFSGSRDEGYWTHSYVKDGQLYMLVLNRDYQEKDVSIPLESYDGKIKLGKFTAEDVLGDREPVSGNGVLKLHLSDDDAQLLHIKTSTAINASALSWDDYNAYIESWKPAAPFTDLESHAWAEEAITETYKKGIVNSMGEGLYAPGQNVTRADFAMFLVRTLGLSGEGEEQFADVDKDAYYAKELAVGKAAGILKGVGDNRFDPEAEISRQDLMTIIARGMNLTAGDETLDRFPDADMVADYAVEHVKAMIASGLIEGNADGTLNPRGNATRAEAAVIMHRILNK